MSDRPAEITPLAPRAMGTDVVRRDAADKVRGRAPYAYEQTVERPLYAHLVTSDIPRGTVDSIDVTDALAAPGVHSVVTHENAPRIADREDREYDVLQGAEIDFHGQIVGIVLADSPEAARHGALLVRVTCTETEFVAEMKDDSPVTVPDTVNGEFPTDTADGDVDAAFARAAVQLDEVYRTAQEHNAAMEPHSYVAVWNEDSSPRVTLHDSTQHTQGAAETVATVFGLETDDVHVICPHVGGGFGSKGLPHAPDVAAVLAARTVPGRAVKLAVTRQQLFSLCGYRVETVNRLRLGAEPDGRLVAFEHAVHEPTSRCKEFAEQTGVTARTLYAADTRRTSHRLTQLDVGIPSWMRAPGVFPGVAAMEMAMDELAGRLGVDPIELRRRNEPDVDPDTGLPFSDRRLMECFDLGAQRFGWNDRPTDESRLDGDWRIGFGVAAATYPGETQPGNAARISYDGGRYTVAIAAADLGTGARTVIGLIAADALGVDVEQIDVEIGDSTLPAASVAGGSSGTSSWGSAIVPACRAFRDQHGDSPADGATTTGPETQEDEKEYAQHSFGAQFAEVAVHRLTGEIRVRRLLGVFSAGRILNPRGARSQFIGGMTMGLGAALMEEGVVDPRFGHVVTQDLATYHVPVNADIPDIEALWLPGADDSINPMGARGIGEIGITGVSAAIANAVTDATGKRIRSLPVTPADVL